MGERGNKHEIYSRNKIEIDTRIQVTGSVLNMVKKTKDDYDIGTSYITAKLKYYVTRLTDMLGYQIGTRYIVTRSVLNTDTRWARDIQLRDRN